LPLCMVFLVALLVVSAMHAVPAEAGRSRAGRALAGGSIGYDPLNPSIMPSAGPGGPYTRPCRYIYRCPPAIATL
ncbi:hypothetical protein BAE44_0015260, partial [Dichanthelium oligosanthes]